MVRGFTQARYTPVGYGIHDVPCARLLTTTNRKFVPTRLQQRFNFAALTVAHFTLLRHSPACSLYPPLAALTLGH